MTSADMRAYQETVYAAEKRAYRKASEQNDPPAVRLISGRLAACEAILAMLAEKDPGDLFSESGAER